MAEPGVRSSIAKVASAKDKPAKAYEVRAGRPQGLLLRVQPSGVRTFYVQIARGQRRRIGPAGTFTLKQAEERAKKIILDPAAFEKRVKAGLTLSDYLDQHYEEHALAQLKNGAAQIARVKSIWRWVLNKRFTEITASEVDRFRNKRLIAGLAPATVNRDVSVLSGVLTHWAEHNKGAKNPLLELKRLKVADDEKIRYLSIEESRRLRKALAARDRRNAAARQRGNDWRAAREYEPRQEIEGYSDHLSPMVLLTLNTGMRQGELFSLAWDAVDLRMKTISVLASHSKGNATRTIPLNAEARAVLAAIRPESAKGLVFRSPVTGARFNNVKKAWTEVTKAAKVPDLRWHDLRHDFASQLVMAGRSLYEVQALLGHKNPQMTQRYAKLAPGTLADAVDTLGIT